MFVVGQSSKKRPDNLTFARTFDNRLLDMCEVGVENIVSMKQLKVWPPSPPSYGSDDHLFEGTKINSRTQTIDALFLRIVRFPSTLHTAQNHVDGRIQRASY